MVGAFCSVFYERAISFFWFQKGSAAATPLGVFLTRCSRRAAGFISERCFLFTAFVGGAPASRRGAAMTHDGRSSPIADASIAKARIADISSIPLPPRLSITLMKAQWSRVMGGPFCRNARCAQNATADDIFLRPRVCGQLFKQTFESLRVPVQDFLGENEDVFLRSTTLSFCVGMTFWGSLLLGKHVARRIPSLKTRFVFDVLSCVDAS